MFRKFIESRSNFDPIGTKELWEEWSAWCKANKAENPFLSRTDFGAQFKHSIRGLHQRDILAVEVVGAVETTEADALEQFIASRPSFDPIYWKVWRDFSNWCDETGAKNPFSSTVDFLPQFKQRTGLANLPKANPLPAPKTREWVFPKVIEIIDVHGGIAHDLRMFMSEIGAMAKNDDYRLRLPEKFNSWLEARSIPPVPRSVFKAQLKKIYGATDKLNPENYRRYFHFPHWDDETGAVEIDRYRETEKDAEIARLKAEIATLKGAA